MEPDAMLVRRLGQLVETVHAVVYFAPEPQERYTDLGLRGYWCGYFASRAAALGVVGPELVAALFAGFAPAMVARAIPSVWSIASPHDVLDAREQGAVAALKRLLTHEHRDAVTAAAALTRVCVDELPLAGRPMAAAHAGAARSDEPLAALWHDCTVLREYRGDGHIAAVTTAGLRWPEPHLLKGASVDVRQQEYRGWDDATWQEAAERSRRFSAEALERQTDEMAAPAFEPLVVSDQRRLVELLTPVAAAAAVQLPYPNAMGLQRL
jgi:hypothetical protein